MAGPGSTWDVARATAAAASDRFVGCLLGLALGDALGAAYEGGPLERLVWRAIGRTREGRIRWTDDTQMSLDAAESLIANGRLDPDDLALRFARNYRWSRGYGPSAARLLKRVARGMHWREANRTEHPEGSFGNGGAMRAPVVGLFYAGRRDDLAAAARLSASITHAHPLGMEGAALVASATAGALGGARPVEVVEQAARICVLGPFVTRLETALRWLRSTAEPGPAEVAGHLGNTTAAGESCVAAVYLAARFLDRSFLELQAFVAAAGGDVDTIGAMAGAVWGAANGSARLPADELRRLEAVERLSAIAAALHARAVDAADQRQDAARANDVV